MLMCRLAKTQDCRHFVVVRRMDVLKYAVSCQLHLRKSAPLSSSPSAATAAAQVQLTCDRPRWTEAVSEMYMILPSEATTNTKPSRVWKENLAVYINIGFTSDLLTCTERISMFTTHTHTHKLGKNTEERDASTGQSGDIWGCRLSPNQPRAG